MHRLKLKRIVFIRYLLKLKIYYEERMKLTNTIIMSVTTISWIQMEKRHTE